MGMVTAVIVPRHCTAHCDRQTHEREAHGFRCLWATIPRRVEEDAPT
jgi:hypothetical protein